jgi:hypothetical protein
MSSKPVDAIVAAPVVSEDPNSPEQKMAKDAKAIQAQLENDSKFDTKLERFCGSPSPQPLLAVGVVLALFAASLYFSPKSLRGRRI